MVNALGYLGLDLSEKQKIVKVPRQSLVDRTGYNQFAKKYLKCVILRQ